MVLNIALGIILAIIIICGVLLVLTGLALAFGKSVDIWDDLSDKTKTYLTYLFYLVGIIVFVCIYSLTKG